MNSNSWFKSVTDVVQSGLTIFESIPLVGDGLFACVLLGAALAAAETVNPVIL